MLYLFAAVLLHFEEAGTVGHEQICEPEGHVAGEAGEEGEVLEDEEGFLLLVEGFHGAGAEVGIFEDAVGDLFSIISLCLYLLAK